MCRCTNLYAQYRLVNDRCMFEHKIRKTRRKKLCFRVEGNFTLLFFTIHEVNTVDGLCCTYKMADDSNMTNDSILG